MEQSEITNSKTDLPIEPKTEINDPDYNKILKKEMNAEIYTTPKVDFKRDNFSPIKLKKNNKTSLFIDIKNGNILPLSFLDALRASADSVTQTNVMTSPHVLNQTDMPNDSGNSLECIQMRNANRDKPYKCNMCSASYSRKCILAKHQKTHAGEKPYTCFFCPATFTCSQYLVEHQQEHAEPKNKCQIYPSELPDGSQQTEHCQRLLPDKEIFKCNICPLEFSTREESAEHQGLHNLERPYSCLLCHATFTFLSQFLQHQKEHFAESTFKCNICHLRLSDNTQLAEHLQKVHTIQELFKCSECPTYFITKSNLTDHHQREHTPDESYKCEICTEGFTDEAHLIEHHQNVHTIRDSYKCDICSVTFLSVLELEVHQRKEKRECRFCHASFINICAQDLHMCPSCMDIYSSGKVNSSKRHRKKNKRLYNCCGDTACSFSFVK